MAGNARNIIHESTGNYIKQYRKQLKMYTSHALIKEKANWYCLLGASKDTPIESISGIITAPNAPRGAPFS